MSIAHHDYTICNDGRMILKDMTHSRVRRKKESRRGSAGFDGVVPKTRPSAVHAAPKLLADTESLPVMLFLQPVQEVAMLLTRLPSRNSWSISPS